MNILIADSGSTKTDWCVIRDGETTQSLQTRGMNPYLQSPEEIEKEIKTSLVPQLKRHNFDAVYFYGAGCTFDKIDVMRQAITKFIDVRTINIFSDLTAAAHSLCGCSAGIACILGTGSNSCFYDGEKIVKNIPPLGFILGDEGGGTVLGKILVSDILKEILSKPLRDAFFERFHLTQADVLDRVYRRPFPNRFLASLSPFISENIENAEIYELVKSSFRAFLSRNVKQYDYKKYKANFVGSIAFHYKDILAKSAAEESVMIGNIEKSPMEGLVRYWKSRDAVHLHHVSTK